MIEKLQEAFKDLRYADAQHKYFTKQGKELQSVTKFLSGLKPKFQSEMGKRGGIKNKGFRWINDGKKSIFAFVSFKVT